MLADTYLTLSLVALIGVVIVTLAALKGWQDWLALKLRELETMPKHAGEPAPLGMASRIEIADLRERLRKLEAIAAGVDL